MRVDMMFSKLFFFRRSLFYKAKFRIGLSEVICKNMVHHLCMCVKYIFSPNIYLNISTDNSFLLELFRCMWNSWKKMLKNWVVHFTHFQLTFCFPQPHVIISIENSLYTFTGDRNWYTMLKQFQHMSTPKSRRNTPGVFSESVKM